jgi:hypothetical protein
MCFGRKWSTLHLHSSTASMARVDLAGKAGTQYFLIRKIKKIRGRSCKKRGACEADPEKRDV